MMERKAWENLAAARLLLQGEDPCLNAAFHTPEATEQHYAWVRQKELRLLDTVQPGSVRLSPSTQTGKRRMDRRFIPARPPSERAA